MRKPSYNYSISILLIVLLSVSESVYAQVELTGYYFGFQYNNASFEVDDSASDISESWGLLHGKFGKAINDLLSIETKLGVSTNADSSHLVYTYEAFLKIGKSLGKYKPYGILGVSGVHVHQAGYFTEDFSGGSYGVGLEIFGSKDLALELEYIRATDTTDAGFDVHMDSMTLGFVYYFSSETSVFNRNRNKIRSIRY